MVWTNDMAPSGVVVCGLAQANLATFDIREPPHAVTKWPLNIL